MNFIVDFLIDYANSPIPYVWIFLMLLACGLGIPIPEDIILFAAGLATYYGICDIQIMVPVCFLGVLIGDSFVFWLGHHYGRRLLKKWPFRLFLDEAKIEDTRLKLRSHGGKLLFAARFMPGVRAIVFFTTGLLHIPYRKLLIYDGFAALLSVPAIVYSVYYFSDVVVKVIKKLEHGIVFLIIAVILFFIGRHYYHKKRRNA